jgi:hypothetical protein
LQLIATEKFVYREKNKHLNSTSYCNLTSNQLALHLALVSKDDAISEQSEEFQTLERKVVVQAI